MRIFRELDPQRQRSSLMLFAAGLLFWAGMAALLPTLPLYVQDLGGTKRQIGMVMGAFAIGLLLSRPWLGSVADLKGRKLVLLLGTLIGELAPMAYLFAHSIPLLLALRVFHGISIAAFTTGYSALVADIAPPDRRGELIGYMSLVHPIGVALGPALGGFLQAWVGYTPLFVMASTLSLLALLCTYQVSEPKILERPLHLAAESVENPRYWQMLLSPRVRIPALVLLLLGLVFGTLSTFMPLYIQETKANLNAGLFYTAAAIASFAIRLATGRASDKYGRGFFITSGLVCYVISMFLLWKAQSSQAFLLSAVFEGCGGGTVVPMIITLMADRCAPHERGRLFSLCVGGFDLGIAIAGPTLGFVAEQVGYSQMFGLATGLAVLALLTFLTQSSKDLPHSLKFALGQGEDAYAFKSKVGS